MKKKCLILLIFGLFFITNVKASGYTYRVRILNANTNLRYDAGGTNGQRVGLLDKNDYYELVSDKEHPDVFNHKRCRGGWYNMIYYTGTTGFVCSDDVEVVKSYSNDSIAPQTACEVELNNAGIPSSYWGGLCKLKERHPNWQFQGINTNLDWSYAVMRESNCGVNYITNKTYDKEFFDKSCTKTSPGNYVAPSQKAIAYYMDPRNFFTEKYIFQFLNQAYDLAFENTYVSSTKSIMSNSEFYKYHTNLGNNLENLVFTYSKNNQVSPIFIGSRITQELGRKTSLYNLYSGVYTGFENKYYGYMNFFNFGVSDSCVAQNGSTYCGLEYALRSGWKGIDAALNGGITKIAKNYINEGQYTGYLQKYNVVPKNGSLIFNHQYMTAVDAAVNESKLNYSAYEANNIVDSYFVFKVPVYKNMSATINNSNSGAIDSNNNTPTPSSIPISTIVTSSGYRYETNYISNIAVGTDVNTLKGSIEAVAGNATVNIYDANGNVASGLVGTGFKVSINNKSTTENLIAVIKGDTSGDGVINALDLLQVQKSILGTFNLNDAYKKSADTSGDGAINALDLLQIQKNILGTYNITQ